MISVIIPAYNAEPYIRKVLDSITLQTRRPDEIVVVNDGSTDGTLKILQKYPKEPETNLKGIKYRVVTQKNKGFSGASNKGIAEAKGDIIVSVDSDAILDTKFIEKAVAELQRNRKTGVVGGYIRTANPESFWARMMGYDLEYRYDHIGRRGVRKAQVEHVSPNNTAYRKEVFKKAGLYDSRFHYCQDVEHSYRVKDAGFDIILLKDVGSRHHWRETFTGYTKQQFNVSYGRMQLISTKPKNAKGDKVAGLRMFLQIPATGLIYLLYAATALYPPMWWIPTTLLALLLIERYEEAAYVMWHKKSISAILMPFIHIWRNTVWGTAALWYTAKRITGKER